MKTTNEDRRTPEIPDDSPCSFSNPDKGELCLRCAGQGRTCCQGHDIYVTKGDCQRIQQDGGCCDFYEYRSCAHADYAGQEDDPIWRQHVFRADGRRRVLKWLADGDCLFLGQSGCSLSLTARPLVCRLYPHLYAADGLNGQWDGECMATRLQAMPSLEKGIAGVAWQQAVQWHHMLYTEILLEDKENENRLDV